jgi:hypothetical protein
VPHVLESIGLYDARGRRSLHDDFMMPFAMHIDDENNGKRPPSLA